MRLFSSTCAFPRRRWNVPSNSLLISSAYSLKAGETKTVSLALAHDNGTLRYWDEAKYDFVLEPGPLELMVGASSADIRLKEVVQLAG